MGGKPRKRVCATCNNPMPRKDGESLKHYTVRKTCCKKCTHKHLSKVRTKYKETEKLCESCESVFYKRSNENASSFHVRRTCGKKCQGALMSKRLSKPDLSKRLCEQCKGSFGRRDGEKGHAFRRRKTCSNRCRYLLTAKGNDKGVPEEKLCPVCGRMFPKRAGETNHSYRKKLTCSSASCQKHVLSKRDPGQALDLVTDKPCEVCGKLVQQRSDEQYYRFLERKTCGGKCTSILKVQSRGNTWHPKLAEKTCQECGKPFSQRANEPDRSYRIRKFCCRNIKNVKYDILGIPMTVLQIAKLEGVDPSAIRQRIAKGRPLISQKGRPE